MRQRAIIGALLLIGVGVALGATVFRTDIAQATGLAQSVTVDNTPANAVPVREQNLDSDGNIKVREQAPMAQDPFSGRGSGSGGGCAGGGSMKASSIIISSTGNAPITVVIGFTANCGLGFTIERPRIDLTLPANESVALSLPERLTINAFLNNCPAGGDCAFSFTALGS